MKKKMIPIALFAIMLLTTTTVFAQSVFEMTPNSASTSISVSRGGTSRTGKYSMSKGKGIILYRISSINGSSDKNMGNSTKLHIIMRDANDTAVLETISDPTNFEIGSDFLHRGNVIGAAGKWYVQFSTKIDGVSYASFYSNSVLFNSQASS